MKGRAMTVTQLVSRVLANGMDIETAANNFDLPPDAISEALAYAREHRELLLAEAAEERRRCEAAAGSR